MSGLEDVLGPGILAALPSVVMLLAAVVAGVVGLVWVRRRLLLPESSAAFRSGKGRTKLGESGRGDWENMLVSSKNLRDEGVLSEEEFRKVRTLVEPPTRTGTPELRPRQRPPADPAGPDAART